MRIALMFLILLQLKLASAATLTIAVVPPGPGINPDMRKTIGHVVAVIDCKNSRRFTSISTSLVHGPYMQSEKEITKFLGRYKSSSKYFAYPLNEMKCEELTSFDNFYRDYSAIHFSPFLDPLVEYRKYQKGLSATPGGTGASYAVALLKMTGLRIPYETCKQNFIGHKFETARSLMSCLTRVH